MFVVLVLEELGIITNFLLFLSTKASAGITNALSLLAVRMLTFAFIPSFIPVVSFNDTVTSYVVTLFDVVPVGEIVSTVP